MEIGERLKEAREAKQLSLDRIQDVTKIQKRYLLAIEEGNFNILPGKFYARAFIKEYAVAVGLNPDELLESYKVDFPSSEEEEEQAVQYSRIQRSRKESHQSKSSNFSFFPTLIVVLLVIAIIFVGITLYQKATSDTGEPIDQTDNDGFIRDNGENDNEPPIPDLDEEEENVEQETEVEEEIEEPEEVLEFVVVEQTRGETTYDLNHAGDQLQLTLNSSGRTWIAVENGDGTSLYSGELTTDASPHEIDISTEERIFIKTGFAPDLQVLVNDTELDIASDPHVQGIWININEE